MTSSTITIRTALAPQGSVKVGMEKYYDEYGCKHWYEYEYFDWSDISAEEVVVDLDFPVDYDAARCKALAYVEALAFEGSGVADMDQVYMVNITTDGGRSFLATGFQTYEQTLLTLQPLEGARL